MKQTAVLATHTRFWPVVALIAWCVVALIVVGLIAGSISAALVSPSHPDVGSTIICSLCKHTPGRAKRILPEGKSWPGGYILYACILSGIFALGHLVVAAALVWRKADDRMALFAAFSLTLLAVVFCARLPLSRLSGRHPILRSWISALRVSFSSFACFPWGA